MTSAHLITSAYTYKKAEVLCSLKKKKKMSQNSFFSIYFDITHSSDKTIPFILAVSFMWQKFCLKYIFWKLNERDIV